MMDGEVDLIEFESPSMIASPTNASPSTSNNSSNNITPKRRLLVTNWDESWSRSSTTETTPKKTLQSLGDDATFLDALLHNMLPSTDSCASLITNEVLPSAPPPETLLVNNEVLPSAPPLEELEDDELCWQSTVALIDEASLITNKTVETILPDEVPLTSLNSSNYESALASQSSNDINVDLDRYLDSHNDFISIQDHEQIEEVPRLQRNDMRRSLAPIRSTEQRRSPRRARSVSPTSRCTSSPIQQITYPELSSQSPQTSSETLAYSSCIGEFQDSVERVDSNVLDRRSSVSAIEDGSVNVEANSGMSTSVQPGPSNVNAPHESPSWTRQSMRRITHFRLADPPHQSTSPTPLDDTTIEEEQQASEE
ncbi:hypothetical protein O3M35_011072 [Rhynocoris fuscipes]|uniref:Uncharacterized protein n=1 Tax=Rhynocoris fuscipes TaxID=488301 RepID=A0AAW1CTT8_9HEMI